MELKKQKEKYIVYENDLKFKNMRNIDPEFAEWHDDTVKEKFGKDFDNVVARLKICKDSGFNYLDLSRLDLEKIPKFTGYTHYNKLINIKYLFLNDNKLSSCDDRLECFENLEVLDISFNNIVEIGFLPKKIKEFICHNNNITVLPSHNFVEIIDCSNNKINCLGKYPKLKDLICVENQITLINKYDMLKKLICRQNPITRIHSQPILDKLDCSETNMNGKIENFPNLTGLICNFTGITNVSNLESLESLEIVGCKMKIPFLKKLKYLLFDNSKESVEIELSDKYKIKNIISEGKSVYLIFD